MNEVNIVELVKSCGLQWGVTGLFFNEKVCTEYLDEILENLDKFDDMDYGKMPEVVVKEILSRKKIHLLIYVNINYFPHLIEEYSEDILDYISSLESDKAKTFLEDAWLNGSKCLFIKILNKKAYEHFYSFKDYLYTDDIVDAYKSEFAKAIEESTEIPNIIKTKTNIIKEVLKLDNNFKILSKFDLKTELFKSNEFLEIYSEKLGIEKDVLKTKIEYLGERNEDILLTLNLEFLKEKYSVINLKHIEKIGLYPEMQKIILKLNENSLKIIAAILDKLDSDTLDYAPIFYSILMNFRKYKYLINNINSEELSDELVDNLINVLRKKENYYNIKNSEDLMNNNYQEKKVAFFKKTETLMDEERLNLYDLKKAVLLKRYGISYKEAKFICDRYCKDINSLKSTNLNKSVFLLLISLNKIIYTDDREYLKFVYKNSEIMKDEKFYLEGEIRKEYAKMYSDSLYKLKDEHLLTEKHKLYKKNRKIYDNIQSLQYNGKTPKFYLLEGDFNIQTHRLGLYALKKDFRNYKESWFRPVISYHGICTSFWGSDMFTYYGFKYNGPTKKYIPDVYDYTDFDSDFFELNHDPSPTYGFSCYEESALLLAGNYDLYSDNAIYSYNTSYYKPCSFYTPQAMKNHTEYGSEIVIERRDNRETSSFKRKPNYIVYIVDELSENYKFDDEIFKESIRASIELDIPIVLIDRTYYKEFNYEKSQSLLKEFKINKDKHTLKILYELIFNNQIWNDKFNYNNFNNIYENVFKSIKEIDNPLKQLELIIELIFIFDAEITKNRSSLVFSCYYKKHLKDKIKDLRQLIEIRRNQYNHDNLNNYINGIEDLKRQLLLIDFFKGVTLSEIQKKINDEDYISYKR